jgi:hypothetical protein
VRPPRRTVIALMLSMVARLAVNCGEDETG